jgi:hypothetical protein
MECGEILSFATIVYIACVDFMLRAARLFGATYRDANAFMFFVLWPVVTVGLVLLNLWQGRTLHGLRLRSRNPRAARAESES